MVLLRDRLLRIYDTVPFHNHPLWKGVLRHELTFEQIIRAEAQHWLRTRSGQSLRRDALNSAQKLSPRIFEMLLETYLEECTDDRSGPSHLELIERLVVAGGMSKEMLEKQIPTAGNVAAIALYRDIGTRGPGCHMLGAGAVEYYYCQLSPRIFEAYTNHYGMTSDQAETYRIHGPMDAQHAERAFSILDDAISLHGFEVVEQSVRDAFIATSLHYDGMLQAATGKLSYWNGVDA